MRQLAAIAITLCSFATACTKKDTGNAGKWPRTVEPRLTGVSAWWPCRTTLHAGHVVEQAECGPINATPPAACDDIISTHGEAVRMLASQPHCTDAAIDALERFARTDPAAMSDLAAGYYIRAQREDRPSDLLRAWEAADHAVAAGPRLPAALFNRALVEEALGLPASWDAAIKNDRSLWAYEARQHRDRLYREAARDASTQWARNSASLPAALRAGDRRAVAQLIASFPSAAERYLEDELLAQWAANPPRERLDEAKLLAEEVSRLSRDRYALDVVEAIGRLPVELRQAHLAFAEARRAERAFDTQKAATSYEKAAQLLERHGNPLRLLARLGFARAMSHEGKPDSFARASALLDPIEREANAHGYRHLEARIQSTRASFFLFQGRSFDSLAAYDAAIALYTRLGDEEKLADTHARRISPLRGLGHHELAWSEAFQATRYASRLVEPRSRHTLLGETAAAALALGHPRIALLYQNAAVELYKKELVAVPPEDTDGIRGVQVNLATALRARAGIELHLERNADAAADLEESMRLAKITDAKARRVLKAREDEVRGQALLGINPARAAAAFTEALASASTELPTFRASLYAQRAEAQRRAGRKAGAESDLRTALEALNAEESRTLAERKPGTGEEFWSSYFSRFQETYQSLIRQLMEEDRSEEAFMVAERSRAFEPLNLVMRPAEIDAISLAEIQASLPPGTFLIEYSVLDTQTIVWIVSHDRFEHLKLPAGRARIEGWSGALQRAARQRNTNAFEAGLYAPYQELIAQPLSVIKTIPKLLVIVPDGAMHGLPFAALHNPVTRRYLIEDFPVSIAGSAKLYFVSLQRDRELSTAKHPSVLLVGDPAFNAELSIARGLRPLKGAKKEVERIEEVYGRRAEMLLGAQATVPRFLELARHSTVVHIAAHAIANAQEPSHSMILLAPSEKDPGVLDAQQLLTRLTLDRTRLVVLSACSSAGGLPVGPEGMAPLVRPLIAAGVPAVIGSLWDVDDATAERLLVSFHRHYGQGSDAAVAMQSAQLELLGNKNPGLRPALAWAPFQVIGHSSSPFAAPRRN